MPCHPLSCQCGRYMIPQRYLISFIGFMSIVLLFNMRVALNLVINAMIPKVNTTDSADSCPSPDDKKNGSGGWKIETDWSELEQSFVRASFFIGYVPAHIPAGICADKFGARLILIICVAISSIFTLIVPIIFIFTNSWLVVGGSRIIVGMGQGMAFPSVSSLLAKWIPKKERAFLGSFAMSGSHVGTIIGLAGSGLLTKWFDNSWKAPFYFFGACGLIFLIVLFLWVWTTPAESPFITEDEKEMINLEIPPKVKPKVPYFAILTDRVVWAMTIGEFGHAFIFFTFSTDLPKYLSQILKFELQENGLISALPSTGMWIASIISGLICDWLFSKKNVRIITLRRWSTVIGNVFPGLFCVAAGFAGCNVPLAVFLLIMVLTSKGPFYTGIKVNYLDVTTNFAGFVLALNNGLAASCGFVSPYIISWMCHNQLVSEWRWYFVLCLAVAVVTTVPYYFMTDDKRRSWDYSEEERNA